MADDFQFDVFLSHSAHDKEIVRPLAERLRTDGLRVWFDEWEIRPGDSIPSKVEAGLEQSRVLVLCMSARALGSHWAQLESGTFRFRDPLNQGRRFIPLRLDATAIKGSLAQFLYIDWPSQDSDQAYSKILEACSPPTKLERAKLESRGKEVSERIIDLNYSALINAYAFSKDDKRILSGANDNTVRVWDMATGHCLQVFRGHTKTVNCIALTADGHRAVTGSDDKTVRIWDLDSGNCLASFNGHTRLIRSVAWSQSEGLALSGAEDNTVRVWDTKTGRCLQTLQGHTNHVWSVIAGADGSTAVSSANDFTIRLWDTTNGSCLRVLEGHSGMVSSVQSSADSRFILSGARDKTLRLWDAKTGRCLRVFEGHTSGLISVALSDDQRFALSGSQDFSMRLWNLQTGKCLCVFGGHAKYVLKVSWAADGRRAFSADQNGLIQVWDLSEFVDEARASKATVPSLPSAPDQVQYTNAKVLLVGESGAGKTGLSKRLALNEWQPSDSTVGAWATQWKLPVPAAPGESASSSLEQDTPAKVEREIWLWDFGGQADQRLVHQLYMDETALAVLVFDGQKEDLFETLSQWDRDLTRASRKEFAKLLVAGRVDAGGLRCSRSQIEAFKKERGYLGFLETSAKTGLRCDDLKQAILNGIRWDDIPWRSSPLLFKRLKEEILKLKDAGRVLMRFNELREALQLRLSGDLTRFTDDQLKAVVSLLTGPGVVWELKFGSWVLLQPERINAYAQAVIQTMREDEHERGCIAEARVLDGDLTYHAPAERLQGDEERFVLLAMHQLLVERGLCLREHTDAGPLLIFPSLYRRERQELVGHPSVLVSYRFNGFLDDVYATLVVKLHHVKPFQPDVLWRYAADFKTLTAKQLGVKLNRRAEGAGELEVYFDPMIPIEEKIIFSKYVHEHLLQKARDVVRLRHYVCPHCGTPVGNREVAMKKLEEGKRTVVCIECEKRVPLWDDLEDRFASDELREQVRLLDQQANRVLDNESKERALVGDVISTVSLAGQIAREITVSDWGLDMEIEFKNDSGEATGKRVYLILKSGDSQLKLREGDGAEILRIENPRHTDYWREQPCPVFLIVRNSNGEVGWMDIREYLKRESQNGQQPVKQIVFCGERFDVMSVRRWRDKALK